MTRAVLFVFVTMLPLSPSEARAQQTPPLQSSELPGAEPQRVAVDVEVIGAAPRTAASSMTLRQELFRDLFVESPADVLRAVPGLVIAQHAGG